MQVILHRNHVLNITQGERIASAIGGGILAAAGLKTRGIAGVLLAAAGGELLRRGMTGHSFLYEAIGIRTAPVGQGRSVSVPYELGVRVDRSVTIQRPRAEVYRYFRDFENFPRFSKYVQSVRKLEDERTHWVVRGPAGRMLEWDAVVHNETPGERIAWRTLPGADVQSAGAVLFREAPGGGTEIAVELQYNPPAGILGAAIAQLMGEEPGQMIEEDLYRLKQVLETGRVPAGEGRYSRDLVDEASEESFPASDAPAYNP